MVTYNDLQLKNKDKLERINAPKSGKKIKVLVFDKYHCYENSITKFNKTDLYEKDEKLGIHGLHVGTVIQQLNKDVILYSTSYTGDFNKVVDYCIKENIRIINTSLRCGYSKAKNEAIKRYAEWGGIWVSASGNDGHNPVDFPASSEYTVGVSATNTTDNNGEEVDTTTDSYWYVSDQFDNSRSFNGTSCATPVISAVASYYLAVNPNGNLESFLKWINLNEIDDMDKVLDYNKSFGKLEESEKFFVFPDDLVDVNVIAIDNNNNNTPKVNYDYTMKLYPKTQNSNGSVNYFLNDSLYTMDTIPIVDENDRTLVPIRFIAEAMGCIINWNNELQEVLIQWNNK